MNEARGYLFDGEDVVAVVRPHHILLLKPVLLPLAGIVLFSAFTNRFTFCVLLVTLLRFTWDGAKWWADRYILTSDRILSMEGVITRRVISMPLAKITDLMYTRSLSGRLFGYGTLDLESAGQQGLERIEYLPDPDNFYRTVMSLALSPRPSSGSSDGASSDGASSDGLHIDLTDTREIPIIRTSDD